MLVISKGAFPRRLLTFEYMKANHARKVVFFGAEPDYQLGGYIMPVKLPGSPWPFVPY